MQPPHSMGMSLANITSASVEQDDIALVTASKAGNQDAFALLVERHQRRVFNLVYRMLQQYEETNEVTQETFFAAWQGLSSFRGDAQFSTWLYRIAYNCALKQLDLRKRDNALQAAIQAKTIENDERVGTELEVRDRQALVREHISTLPAKYRIVLVLRHLQEMTYEEMAEILTMPIGTIKTHLFRARNLLKERLEAFDQEWKSRG
ncbi:RNA polymerase sigma factor [Dictyobacter arantiisoli]|uniref:RNA polymerase sigma factor n=1 Tax=Dictyobacter arantiisoli TaxID=2014874 RepID=UPI00155ADA5E|nr:sigma-70 family RNA polymerase sigma factor [Dictyobacter arantiisoli]